MTSVGLVALGVVVPSEPVDDSVLRRRLLLWGPWFLVWGLLLGVAAWLSSRRAGSTGSRSGPGIGSRQFSCR